MAFALAVAQAVGAAVGLAVGAVSCTERGALMAAVLVLGIVLAISGMLVPPSGAFNSMVPVFKASPVRWVYGALMAHDHSASLNALGFGRDGYLANLFRAGVMAPIALVFAHRALGRRELT